MTAPRRVIPVVADTGPGECSGAESFALLVLGDSMAPDAPLCDLSPVRGVVIQKSRPGHRLALKRYVE